MTLVKRRNPDGRRPPDSVLPASDEALNESSPDVIASIPHEVKAPKGISASVSQHLMPSRLVRRDSQSLRLGRIGLLLLLEPFYFLSAS